MELSRYPLDRQVCAMQISSCKSKRNFQYLSFIVNSPVSKTTRELELEWKKDTEPVTVAKDLKMPQFELEAVTASNCHNKIHMGRLFEYISNLCILCVIPPFSYSNVTLVGPASSGDNSPNTTVLKSPFNINIYPK